MMEPRDCANCGSEYQPRAQNQRYCGANCRREAAALRRDDLPEADRLLIAAGLAAHAQTFENAVAADELRAHQEQYRLDHARTILAEAGADGYRISEDGRQVLIPSPASSRASRSRWAAVTKVITSRAGSPAGAGKGFLAWRSTGRSCGCSSSS